MRCPPLCGTAFSSGFGTFPMMLALVSSELLALMGNSVPASAVNRLMDAEADKWGASRLPHLD